MSEEKFGLVTWDEDVSNRGASNRKRDEFMRLKPGSNRLRVITPPAQYWVHKWKEEGDKGFGDKVYCSKFHGSCPLCSKGDRAKRRWFSGVIDRATGTYKVLDMGLAIYQQLQTYNRDTDWGAPTQYDVDVVVDPKGGATGYYKVVPKPKTPLSDEDVDIKQNIDIESLKERCSPPSPEEVQRRMDRIRARKNGNDQVAAEVQADAAVEGSTEDDFSFPPADKASVSASA